MTTEAGQLGVNSTPSLFLNGVRIDFTGKYEDLKAEIDAALAG
jgi:protein-disulfide isomerase